MFFVSINTFTGAAIACRKRLYTLHPPEPPRATPEHAFLQRAADQVGQTMHRSPLPKPVARFYLLT